MFGFYVDIEWRSPIYPNKGTPELKAAVARNFQRWLIGADIRWRGDAFVLSIGLLGFRVTFRLSKPRTRGA